MRYRNLGRTGLKVSEFCLGTMTFGGAQTDEAESGRIVDRYLELGGNLVDCADIYNRGISEEILGRALKGRRHDVVLATKVRGRMGSGANDEGLSRLHIMDAVEGSLRRLDSDYIDLYQMHWPDLDTPIEETLRALDDLVRQGKVRYAGCSNYKPGELSKALATSDKLNLVRFSSLQPHYSLINREEFESELQAICLSEGLGVIPYSPLGGGFLTGKYRKDAPIPEGTRAQLNSGFADRRMTERNWQTLAAVEEIALKHGATPAQVALAWLLANPAVTAPIVGATRAEQLNETLQALTLPAEDIAQIREASR